MNAYILCSLDSMPWKPKEMLKSTKIPVSIIGHTILLALKLFPLSQSIEFSVVLFVNKTMLCMDKFQIWDAGTGQVISQYTEHQKRAWSVDFSRADPTVFASGSDDCSIKLWSVNDVRSVLCPFNYRYLVFTFIISTDFSCVTLSLELGFSPSSSFSQCFHDKVT